MSNRARQGIAGVLVALVTILAAPQVSRAAAAEQFERLNLSGYRPGTKPPEFKGTTADSRIVSLDSLRGKVVLLNFWASWCLECRPEMPIFERLHREFAAQGLSVVGINAREGIEAIRAYAKELRLTFPLVLDPKGEINAAYGVIGLPATFLVGRDGRAVARAVGPRNWESAPARAIIQALLSEAVSAKVTRWAASEIKLAIVNVRVNLPDGAISVESEQGKGLKFTITLPIGVKISFSIRC
jgi:cytochrome c biogenesis protein CcmG/thiol:disulfide interchange protein DsbE